MSLHGPSCSQIQVKSDWLCDLIYSFSRLLGRGDIESRRTVDCNAVEIGRIANLDFIVGF